MSACSVVNFSRMLEKDALIVLPSNSLDDCRSWQFDGLWKSEELFRLTSLGFSGMFIDLICHNGNYCYYQDVKFFKDLEG